MRRKKRFKEIKTKIAQLLEPLPISCQSIETVNSLKEEAKALIGFSLLNHGIPTVNDSGEPTLMQENHFGCAHCARDPLFYDERIQLVMHRTSDVGKKSLMLPDEFYHLHGMDVTLFNGGGHEIPEPVLDSWMQERLPNALNELAGVFDTIFPTSLSREFLYSSASLDGRALPRPPGEMNNFVQDHLLFGEHSRGDRIMAFRYAARHYAQEDPSQLPIFRYLIVVLADSHATFLQSFLLRNLNLILARRADGLRAGAGQAVRASGQPAGFRADKVYVYHLS